MKEEQRFVQYLKERLPKETNPETRKGIEELLEYYADFPEKDERAAKHREFKANCARCGLGLEEISYIQPDWKNQMSLGSREILCTSCWLNADTEARNEWDEEMEMELGRGNSKGPVRK